MFGREKRVILGLVLLLGTALAAPASPQAAIRLETLRFSSTEADGAPSQLAGAHPDQVTASFVLAAHEEEGVLLPDESPRNLTVDLPLGMIGNAAAVPACPVNGAEGLKQPRCPPESQIGYVEILAFSDGKNSVFAAPLYNLEPSPGTAATFGLGIENAPTLLVGRVEASRDYGISLEVRNLPQGPPWTRLKVVLWGTPADPSHDGLRGTCLANDGTATGQLCPSDAPRRPFLTNPSACMDAVAVTAHVDSWLEPGVYDSKTASNEDGAGRPVGIVGCESLGFDPTVSLGSTASTPRTPSGLTVALHAPRADDPDGRAEATLEKATVTLPAGVAISPAAGAGLGVCTAGQIRLGSDDPPACPDGSKLGRLRIETPLLDEPLEGSVYLAQPRENPFGSLFAIYAAAAGRGVLVKLAGRVDPDPQTGRVRVIIDRIPQLPFGELEIDLWPGPRALLSTPPRCGTYAATAELKAWGAAVAVDRSASLRIASACTDPRFLPAFKAGSGSARAAAFSTFALRLRRSDTDEEFGALPSVQLPPGLSVRLKGTTFCPESALSVAGLGSPTRLDCPGSSRVGRVVVGAGPGSRPIYIAPGDVFLAGPYEGAPLSLAVSVPALVGPFDLGSVNLRAALRVDPVDLHAEVDFDRLPTLLAGVPLQIRDLRLEIDRPRFVFNPSSCEGRNVTATVLSSEGTKATVSSPFGAVGCRRLGFAPKLSVRLSGAPTRRGAHPRVQATLRTRRGDANSARIALTMPPTELLATAHIRSVCSRSQYSADRCPRDSIYGFAEAFSPLLDRPLRGPVYLRSSQHTLPDLAASLDGTIHVDLAGKIDSPGGRLRATFRALPDLPVSKFVLTMPGGKRGLLVNNTDLCRAKPRAKVELIGQNGRVELAEPPVKVDCAGAKR